MKILSEQELQAHSNATIRGAVEGAAGGIAVAVPSFYLLNKRWPYYRTLQPSLKLMGAIFLVVPAMVIRAERKGLQYERSQWYIYTSRHSFGIETETVEFTRSGAGKMELDREALEKKEAWEALNSQSKVKNFLINHQYSIMAGSWVASCAVAGSIIWRNKYQTGPQKIVQIRMWAQGLTVGVILAAGILTHRNQKDMAERGKPVDHSWAAMLEEQRLEEEARKVKLQQTVGQT